MPQLQAEVPYPLRDHLPALLSPGRVTAPPIGVDLLIFIRERRLKGSTMQIQLNDVGSGECLLRQRLGKDTARLVPFGSYVSASSPPNPACKLSLHQAL